MQKLSHWTKVGCYFGCKAYSMFIRVIMLKHSVINFIPKIGPLGSDLLHCTWFRFPLARTKANYHLLVNNQFSARFRAAISFHSNE